MSAIDPARSAAAPGLAERRAALSLCFLLLGAGLASWATRTPAIRDAIAASTAGMGLILAMLSIGSIGMILASGRLTRRFGNRRVLALGMALVALSMLTIAAGSALGLAPVVGLGLGLFGAGMGAAEIALNIAGASLERDLRRPVLTALHGFFSLGGAAGALAGLLLTRQAVPVVWHLPFLALALVLAMPAVLRCIPADAEQPQTADGGRAARPRGLLRDPRLWALALIIWAMALAEGSANDWLPMLIVDDYGLSPSHGALVFLCFTLAMALLRFGAGPVIARLGRSAVVTGSALAGGLGIGLIAVAQHPAVAALAGMLWGVGAALGFPVTLSAAADSDDRPEERVRIVAVSGYLSFLAGPPLLGLIGEHFTLRIALLAVMAFLVLAACVGPTLGRR